MDGRQQTSRSHQVSANPLVALAVLRKCETRPRMAKFAKLKFANEDGHKFT